MAHGLCKFPHSRICRNVWLWSVFSVSNIYGIWNKKEREKYQNMEKIQRFHRNCGTFSEWQGLSIWNQNKEKGAFSFYASKNSFTMSELSRLLKVSLRMKTEKQKKVKSFRFTGWSGYFVDLHKTFSNNLFFDWLNIIISVGNCTKKSTDLYPCLLLFCFCFICVILKLDNL